MAEDLIRYDILAQDALRGVVRKVLAEVSRTGLPGEHHFFVCFATRAAGVRISSRLLADYPEEMTIVLQHRFWDLTVTEHAFEVRLSFKNQMERLLVPFTAIKSFLDPSVQFALQFEILGKPGEELKAVEDASVVELGEHTAEPVEAPRGALPRLVEKPKEEAETPAPASGEAQVVSLDAFRKK
jgi:hypothetical protein